MLLQLVGIESIDNRALTNFSKRVFTLIRRRRGGDEPEIRLRICHLNDGRCAGDLQIKHKGEEFRYSGQATDPKGVLIEILAQVISNFRYSLTDLIQCDSA